ncbi:hypothetical protein BC628DRAFT_243281 [Trametes gibbosa]|nr:hypothetical protein BC628DRAFT_243281 [Trametes gibbosa]
MVPLWHLSTGVLREASRGRCGRCRHETALANAALTSSEFFWFCLSSLSVSLRWGVGCRAGAFGTTTFAWIVGVGAQVLYVGGWMGPRGGLCSSIVCTGGGMGRSGPRPGLLRWARKEGWGVFGSSVGMLAHSVRSLPTSGAILPSVVSSGQRTTRWQQVWCWASSLTRIAAHREPGRTRSMHGPHPRGWGEGRHATTPSPPETLAVASLLCASGGDPAHVRMRTSAVLPRLADRLPLALCPGTATAPKPDETLPGAAQDVQGADGLPELRALRSPAVGAATAGRTSFQIRHPAPPPDSKRRAGSANRS